MKKKKSLPKLKQELQLVFNSFVRRRDEGKPCISCGQFKEKKQAGHYFPVQGYDGLRFDEFNVNGECVGCNCFDDSHLIHYGENLRGRIGEDEYNWLKDCAAEYKRTGHKWSRSEIIEQIAYYKLKLKDYE